MAPARNEIYRRGEFWLDHVRGTGRKPVNDRLYVWWYDRASGRLKRKSTGTSDVRLASDFLDRQYLASHRATDDEQSSYTVSEALADYWTEHGSGRVSAESIKARLKLVTRFIDAEMDAGRLVDPFLPEQVDDRLVARFRRWALADPIVARRKDEHGAWTDGQSRPRSASTVEESVIQLKAALNHAHAARRIRAAPAFEHLTRDAVTPERSYRLSMEALGELLDYSFKGAGRYAGHADRLLPLRRYLIAAIATLARPDAILDMSVDPAREQWMREEGLFALNPAGRLQTKKHRPTLPVVPTLSAWLEGTQEWMVCRERTIRDPEGEPKTEQLRVAAVRSAWDGARRQLGIREGYGPKIIRHSMATILTNRGVDLVQLEVALGHRVLHRTTRRYATFGPTYLDTVAAGIADVFSELEARCADALAPPPRCRRNSSS
ncbi:tyrosine-type recombinase/integrase [Sphingomonas sp. BK580]|uniref:tyrosine-type recombinase/integrase n=1 Tax=Sphingomonas sp. BK580 TaxID=2586972 RepID=UPI00160BE352|nr:tyrosine-type recombinase/integrase [Sphingomonas sp. BK580]MBB3693561.1 hypothetical protein [Sphingomonas sp. BK580]